MNTRVLNKSWRTYEYTSSESFMAHVWIHKFWISHGTHMNTRVLNKSRHTYEWHTYEYTSSVWMHAYVCHDVFFCSTRLLARFQESDGLNVVLHLENKNWFMRTTLLIQTYGRTHSSHICCIYVCHYSFLCATWLMAHFPVRYDSWLTFMSLCDMTHNSLSRIRCRECRLARVPFLAHVPLSIWAHFPEKHIYIHIHIIYMYIYIYA